MNLAFPISMAKPEIMAGSLLRPHLWFSLSAPRFFPCLSLSQGFIASPLLLSSAIQAIPKALWLTASLSALPPSFSYSCHLSPLFIPFWPNFMYLSIHCFYVMVLGCHKRRGRTTQHPQRLAHVCTKQTCAGSEWNAHNLKILDWRKEKRGQKTQTTLVETSVLGQASGTACLFPLHYLSYSLNFY